MPRDGTATRTRILDAAQRLVLRQGFTATTVDAVIADAGVAKGAFFHHFPSKAALAEALIRRYADADAAHLDEAVARARALVRDPLQRLLVLIGLLEEDARTLGPEQGCLFASFLYERQLVDDVTRPVIRDSMIHWRTVIGDMLRQAAAVHPPATAADLDAVADSIVVMFEGSFVLSRAVGEPAVAAGQLRALRTHLELLFGVAPGAPA